MPPEFTEDVQRAAAYIAARSRGDQEAAAALIEAFDGQASRAQAFAVLAELALTLIARYDDEPVDGVATRLALTLAQV